MDVTFKNVPSIAIFWLLVSLSPFNPAVYLMDPIINLGRRTTCSIFTSYELYFPQYHVVHQSPSVQCVLVSLIRNV
ncbi:hypothetical protein B0J17DRAFT_660293 [Rhizoctonia solani]|nr:hypothetical protein B0J17DRAFT_660293 [Rhizoctonia solani]